MTEYVLEEKTFIVHCPKGTANGTKKISLRWHDAEAFFMSELDFSGDAVPFRNGDYQPGIYFLFDSPRVSDISTVYIGQTQDFERRMSEHRSNDVEFCSALIFQSSRGFEKTHVELLERMAIAAAKKSDRYIVKNGTNGNSSHATPETMADVAAYFYALKEYLSLLGIFVFEPKNPKSIQRQQADQQIEASEELAQFSDIAGATRLFICRSAFGYYDPFGKNFYVTKGSELRGPGNLRPEDKERINKQIEALLNQKIIVPICGQPDRYEVTEEIKFPSPSSAALVATGSIVNGWTEWKLDGTTLSEFYRKTSSMGAALTSETKPMEKS